MKWDGGTWWDTHRYFAASLEDFNSDYMEWNERSNVRKHENPGFIRWCLWLRVWAGEDDLSLWTWTINGYLAGSGFVCGKEECEWKHGLAEGRLEICTGWSSLLLLHRARVRRTRFTTLFQPRLVLMEHWRNKYELPRRLGNVPDKWDERVFSRRRVDENNHVLLSQ